MAAMRAGVMQMNTIVLKLARHLFVAAVAGCGVMASAHAGRAGEVAGTTCPTFPDNGWWHADISKLPKHAKSDVWMSHFSAGLRLHPDFGPSFGAQKVPYGIPITIVSDRHALVRVKFHYASES